jgi:hypothetical protein
MNISRDEAASALAEIDQARGRIIQLQGYHHGAQFFIIWGLVWLIANIGTYLFPAAETTIWPASLAIGALSSISHGIRTSLRGRQKALQSPATRREWRQAIMTSLVVMAFITCLVMIADPASTRQLNAMISIVFPFLYMVGGIWVGWRLFIIGLVTAIGIMAGYVWIPEHFELWMGLFGGGSLIAGGVWLRKA